MLQGHYERYVLRFLFEARTSRERMWEKEVILELRVMKPHTLDMTDEYLQALAIEEQA